jgi:hypothetical protein
MTALEYQGQWFCQGTVTGVNNGTYGTGARIALLNGTVQGLSGTVAQVSFMVSPVCTDPSGVCFYPAIVGYGMTEEGIYLDFAGMPSIPEYGHVVDVYGVTGGPGVLILAAYEDKGLNLYDPTFEGY